MRDFWHEYKIGGLPREVEISRRLTSTGSRFILPYRAHCLIQDHSRVRIYTAFAKYGDLNRAIRHRHQDLNYGPIPEPYIWYAAQSLVSALETMESGRRDDGKYPSSKWVGILHLDIKPSNIVLVDPPDESRENELQWLDLQLIDFGNSYGLWPRYENPTHFQNRGATVYMAPEARLYAPHTQPPQKVHHQADIYMLGQVLYCLMNPWFNKNVFEGRIWAHTRGGGWFLHMPASAKKFDANYTSDKEEPHDIAFHPAYSKELTDMVEQCLQFWPQERFTPTQLGDIVRQHIDSSTSWWREEGDSNNPLHLAGTGGEWDLGQTVPMELRKREDGLHVARQSISGNNTELESGDHRGTSQSQILQSSPEEAGQGAEGSVVDTVGARGGNVENPIILSSSSVEKLGARRKQRRQ
jgi:serine/threonine protein kinase